LDDLSPRNPAIVSHWAEREWLSIIRSFQSLSSVRSVMNIRFYPKNTPNQVMKYTAIHTKMGVVNFRKNPFNFCKLKLIINLW
jgi:hypothetical protein